MRKAVRPPQHRATLALHARWRTSSEGPCSSILPRHQTSDIRHSRLALASTRWRRSPRRTSSCSTQPHTSTEAVPRRAASPPPPARLPGVKRAVGGGTTTRCGDVGPRHGPHGPHGPLRNSWTNNGQPWDNDAIAHGPMMAMKGRPSQS